MRILCALLMTVATLTAADYTQLKTWTGSGTKETETFEVTAKEWRLVWAAKPIDKTFAGDGRFVFRVAIHKEGSAVPVSRLEGGQSEQAGESFVRGAGRYFLKVSSVNAQWTLTAEQP
jgi:hypothetical protein